jgi:hypothetical protein
MACLSAKIALAPSSVLFDKTLRACRPRAIAWILTAAFSCAAVALASCSVMIPNSLQISVFFPPSTLCFPSTSVSSNFASLLLQNFLPAVWSQWFCKSAQCTACISPVPTADASQSRPLILQKGDTRWQTAFFGASSKIWRIQHPPGF